MERQYWLQREGKTYGGRRRSDVWNDDREQRTNMSEKPNGLKILSFVLSCVIVVLPTFLCGCNSHEKGDGANVDAAAYLTQGIALVRKGRPEDAILVFEKAIAIKPDYADAYHNMGVAYGELGQHAEAIAACKKAFAIRSGFADAYYNMGISHSALRQYTEAIAAYKKAVAIKADYAEAYYNMGLAYNNLGRFAEAIAAYTEFIAIEPDYADAYDNRAVSYYNGGEYDKAWADVKAFRKLDGKVQPGFLAKLRKASGREE